MSQTPEPLSPKRLTDIREALDLLAQLEQRVAAESIPVPPLSEADKTAKWYADMAADLLRHIDAREAQVREVLAGLFVNACVVDSRGPITQDDILAAANTLAIDL